MATTERTPLTRAQIRELLAPLHPSRVSKRTQGNKTLSYVEAYDVKAMLVRVFGFGKFDFVTTDSVVLDMREVPKSSGNGTNWRVTVKVQGRLTIHQTGAVYEEGACSSNTNPDLGDALDNAIKTATSDALKRCAIFLGTQYGLSLYNNGRTDDVVQVLFDPEQGPVLQRLHEENAKAVAQVQGQQEVQQLQGIVHGQRLPSATPEQQAAGQAMIDHAMGGRPAQT